MATFSHSVSTSTVHRWSVPAAEPFGAAAEEIAKAWGAAETTYREVHGIPKDAALSGNAPPGGGTGPGGVAAAG